MRTFCAALTGMAVLALSPQACRADVTAGTADAVSAAAAPVAGPVLSQTDPRWGGHPLGRSTIAREGCLVTVLAMLGETTPDRMVQVLRNEGVLDSRGLVRTSELGRALPFQFIARTARLGLDPVAFIDMELTLGSSVILELDHSAHGGPGTHFVLATAVKNGTVVVADPAGGRVAPLTELYGRLGIRTVILLSNQAK